MYYEPGNLLLFSGTHPISWLIRIATWSPYSHVGICFRHAGGSLLCESTTMLSTPCVIEKRKFSGVQAQVPWDRVRTHEGRVWVMRPYWPLTDDESDKLTDYCLHRIGTQYDAREAAYSATHVLKKLFTGTPNKAFCSEEAGRALVSICRVPPPPIRPFYGPFEPSDYSPAGLTEYLQDIQVYREPEQIK